MPRCLLGILIFLLASVPMARAQGDIALLRIGEETISRSEFEFYFNRSSVDSPELFIADFVRYKTKVLYAKELGLDTLPAFLAQKTYYEQELFKLYSEHWNGKKNKEWIRLKLVTKCLPQRLDKSEEQKAKAYMDSVYIALINGTNVPGVPMESLWIPKQYLLPEWIEVLDELKKGEYSKPFYSPMGIHVICWEEKGSQENRMGLNGRSERQTDSQLLLQEMEESLLVAVLEMTHKASYTEEDLETFFSLHRADYHWELPRYRGVVFHSRNKKLSKAMKKYLKRYDYRFWKEALDKMDVCLLDGCLFEYGIFQIGKNKYVDRLVFKCGEFEPLKDYPYTFVMGKKMKRPESYRDVREEVLSDYLKSQEIYWEDVIKQKYKVEINEEVLKTVNNSGNN